VYTKIVKSGTLVEIFSYAKAPEPYQRRRKSRTRNPRRYRRNVSRSRATFFRLVRSNLGAGARPAFVTLTMREVVSVKAGWRAYTLFSQRLKNSFKGRAALVGVLEFQERGAIHFHCLVWGLTDEEIAQERSTRRIAKLWGHGFVDVRQSDGSPKLAGYLAKYMFKAMYDERLSGQKSYSASRSLVRSVPLTGKEAVALVVFEIEGGRINTDGTLSIGVDNPLVPEIEREYDTQWLGKCNYKAYNLDSYGKNES